MTYAACSNNTTLLVKEGDVFAVGRNYKGMLGQETIDNPTMPKVIPFFDEKIHIEGVAAGLNHCMAWSSLGKLYSWGTAKDGCLGYKDKLVATCYQTEP